jgi:hypothetical protein
MKTSELIKTIFCARDQKDTDHVLSSSPSGEVVLTCECGEFVKFPTGIKKIELDKLIKKHKEANEGQISMDKVNANLKELV